MKKKTFAAVAMSLCFSSTSFAAGGLDPQGLFYLNIPFGASSKQERAPTFGFMLRQTPHTYAQDVNPVQRLPLLDLRYTSSGLKSLAVMGMNTQRLKANDSAAKDDDDKGVISWWLIGGVVVGAVLINNASKSTNDNTVVSGAGGR